MFVGREDGPACVGLAAGLGGQGVDRLAGFTAGRLRRAAHAFKEQVESRAASLGGEPVPGAEQSWVGFLQHRLLVGEDFQRDLGVLFGVVPSPGEQLTVLIVLDQAVIRVARERQGVEPKRVDRRQFQQAQVWIRGSQMLQVEVDEVVPQHEVCAFGQVVELGERPGQARPL